MSPRILIVTASSDIGGSERQVLHLASRLPSRGFDVHVLSLGGGGELTKRLSRAGVPARTCAARGPAGRRWEAKRELAYWRPAVAYLFGLRTDLLLRGACARAGARVVSAIRNTDPWRTFLHSTLDRATARHVDLFISNSQAGKESRIWRERFAADLIRVVPNGVELPDLDSKGVLRTRFRARHGIPEHAPLVGQVANYRAQKGHVVALRALGPLARRWPDLRMVFAGEEFDGGRTRELIAGLPEALRARVLALPHQPEPDALYAALDVFILPSDYEGTPNTLMEAMAWGVPSVSTRAGGIPEVLSGVPGGTLIPPGSARCLARAIDSELRAGLARTVPALRERIESRFSIDAMVAAHAAIFRSLAGRRA